MKTNKMSKKTAKKLVANYNRRVARDNKAFEKLSPSEKRVAIARDVLNQIRINRLIPTLGIWLSGKGGKDLLNNSMLKNNPELKEVLGKMKQCEGCALGGMFMCAVERADDLKIDKLEAVQTFNDNVKAERDCGNTEKHHFYGGDIDGEDAFKYLGKFFSIEQLELIESCFEQNTGAEYSEEAKDFLPDEVDPSERMRLIMENIVVNKGRFCPNKEPVMRYETPGFTG